MASRWTSVCLSVRPPVRPSVFHFRMITLVNINGFSSDLICALICGLGLPMGNFRQILTELSARDTIMAGYYSLTFLFIITIGALDLGSRGPGFESR